jgi:hypothetical protein
MYNRKKSSSKKLKDLFTLTLLIIFPLSFFYFSTVVGYASQEEKPSITKAIKKKGWDMPWATQSVVFSVESKKIKIQNVNVTEKQLIPSTDLLMVLEAYGVEEKTKLSISTYTCVVSKLQAYENNGQRFCYKALLEPVAIDVDGGIKQRYGFVFIVYYYDDDGDGTFETIEFDLKELRLAKYMESK